jgi:hypothetical protein
MIATLLLLSQAAQTVQLGTVDVGGRQVAVTVPAARGPFGPETPHVEIGGWKFQVRSDGNLGVRYRTDGGWGEVAESYPAVATKAASAPEYRIKVFVLDNTMVLEHGRDGVWRERYGSMSPAQKDEIYASLARMKALAETATEGRVRVTFDVVVDSDLLFRVARAGEATEHRPPPTAVTRMAVGARPEPAGLLGPSWVYDEIGPRVNNDLFEGEDKRYRGPYSSVFVVHATRIWDAATYVVDRTPVSTISWATFTEREPGTALSIQLFYAWLQHLDVSADASLRDSAMTAHLPTGDVLPTVPHVFDTPVSTSLLKNGNRLQAPGFGDGVAPREFGKTDFSVSDARNYDVEKLPPLRGEGAQTLIGWVPQSSALVAPAGEYTAVHPSVAARYMEANAGAMPVGRIGNADGGWDYVLFSGAEKKDNDLAALGLEVGSLPALLIEGPAPTTGTIALAPTCVGEFQATVSNDPTVGQVVTVLEQGSDRRGHVVLASSPGLIKVEEDTALSFRASCDISDAYVLRVVTASGKSLDAMIFGSAAVPAERDGTGEVVDARRRPGPFWNEFVVPIGALAGETVTEIQLAPPRYASYYARESDGSKSLKIGALSFGPGAATEPQGDPPNAEVAWLAQLDGALDPQAVQRVRTALQSGDLDVRLNALGALNRTKNEDLIPDVAPHTSSGSPGEAYLAVRALMHQDVDRAWSGIAHSALRGPFGMNYMFAADALGAKKENVTLEVLGVPLLSLSWRARWAAVRSVNQIDTEQAAVVASATLGAPDPEPIVRFEIVAKDRPASGLFARRLLFAAVNDESEWVRATSYLKLIDSETAEIRDQALRGVRDESVAVRLAILAAMARAPKEHYRSALRTAVVDQQAVVRAAALRAFAVQPGAVVAAEVQNTLADRNPLVRAALLELAKAKGIEVPPLP